jgi:aldehyde dehydrogenase (NAD+)
MWTETSVHEAVLAQRRFFRSGKTLDIKWRKEQLQRLYDAVKEWAPKMEEALKADLGRAPLESYFCDVGTILMEIKESIHHLKRWAKPERHYSGLIAFPSCTTKVYKMPYGVTLIISPFNFPFLLSLGVLNASLSGGNTAILKASSKSVHCTEVLKEMVAATFPPEYVTVVDGGHDVADYCLKEKFDKIFYTGSPRVGKHVLALASENLTPAALELGGETGNWCVVRKDANLKDAAKKIAFFKACNAGQICININQVAVAEEVADEFVEELKKAFTKQLGDDPLMCDEYPHLIGEKAYDACAAEAEEYRSRIVYGGRGDKTTLRYSPTIIDKVGIDEPIVMHELFSPLLPIVRYKDEKIDDLLDTIASREHGLALYLFTKDKKWAEGVMSSQQYGGGAVNEVIMQLIVKGVPFNGVGHSGMGAYHGEWGFREFTHPSTALYGKTHMNLPLRNHPYRKSHSWLIRKIEK